MGTDKRQRQKANRTERRQAEHRSAHRRALQRRIGRIGAIVVLGVVAVVVIAWIGGAFDGDDEAAPDAASEQSSAAEGDTATGADDAVTTTNTDTGTGPQTECPPVDGVDVPVRTFVGAPPLCIDPALTYSAEVTTNFGSYTIELDPAAAPLAVNNFVVLARYGYYDDTVCHRIIPGFVVQCGDPTATGTGGPGYAFADELPEAGAYQVGSVAMANSGPDTNGSQFFIVSGPDGAALPPQYSLFGTVTAGLDTIAALDELGSAGAGTPVEEVRIERVTITES